MIRFATASDRSIVKRSLALAAFAILVACGGLEATSPFPVPDAASFPPDQDGGCPSSPWCGCEFCTDASPQPPCVNLQCQQVNCGNGATTTISGTVYDPSGALPLYNALVYVPNAPLDPITAGPTCCITPSGSPLQGAETLTDPKGHFIIANAPVGTNIPVVIQAGKWRRTLQVPTVAQCIDNPTDPKLTRLPRKEHETSLGDNIPKIAIATGCDALECMLSQRMGVDTAEITGPLGSGSVHVYRGADDAQGLPAQPGDATVLFGSAAIMAKYDEIWLASDCGGSHARGSSAEANLESYLAAGGRVLATHSQVNWFASAAQCSGADAATDACIGDSDMSSLAQWRQSSGLGGPYSIVNDFPPGLAMSKWYDSVTMLAPFSSYHAALGQLPLVAANPDVGPVTVGKGSRFVIAGNPTGTYDTHLLSFSAPVNQPPAKQCGRAIFSSAEAVGVMSSAGSAWPASCAGTFTTADHTPNELAMEFMEYYLQRWCAPN